MKRSWMRRLFVFVLILAPVIILQMSGSGAGKGTAAPASLTAPEPGTAAGWLVKHPDAPLSFSEPSQHSLRLDASGNPRMAYGGDHLYYTYQDSGGWHTETADAAWNVGAGAALALDSGGKAHISYFDSANNDLKYATNKSGAWQVQTVAAVGYVGQYSDIAIDVYGDPAFVYYDSTNHQLRYIYYDSELGGWGPDEQVAADIYAPNHPGWFSFALDTSATPFNKPHISYYKATSGSDASGDLYYATYSNGWTNTLLEMFTCTLPDTCPVGEYNSLALNPVSKNPSVAYSYDGNPGPMLAYSYYNGSNWVIKEIIASVLPTYITLAMDASRPVSRAQVTYQYNGFNHVLRTGVNAWTAESINAGAGAGQWSSLALYLSTPHVLYYNTETGVLHFVERDGVGDWAVYVNIATQGPEVGECS